MICHPYQKRWFLLCTFSLFISIVFAQNPFDIVRTTSGEIAPINESVDTNITLIDSVSKTASLVNPATTASSTNPFNIKSPSGTNASNNKVTQPSNDEVIQNQKPPSQNKQKLARKDNPTDKSFSLNFVFWLLLVSILIVTVVINLKRKTFLNLYRSITNDNYLKLLQREENNGLSLFFLLLYTIFFINASLFSYLAINTKYELGGYKSYLLILGVIIGIYIIRYISMTILHLIFPLEKEAKQFNFTIIMFNVNVGLLLIPINILLTYVPIGNVAIYIGLAIILGFYLFRQLRGLFIAARARGLNYFHFFIYLCAIEVAPIFWLISVISNWYSIS